MRRLLSLAQQAIRFGGLSLGLLAWHTAPGQALPAATGPGLSIDLGGTLSRYQIDYGQRDLTGASVYADFSLRARLGLEIEARDFFGNEDESVHARTYLAGPRVILPRHALRPYAKLLVGRGTFYFPFGDAVGSYFVIAPGGGVDLQIGHTRLIARLIDVEYQRWPSFSFGALQPYGASAGLSFTLHRP